MVPDCNLLCGGATGSLHPRCRIWKFDVAAHDHWLSRKVEGLARRLRSCTIESGLIADVHRLVLLSWLWLGSAIAPRATVSISTDLGTCGVAEMSIRVPPGSTPNSPEGFGWTACSHLPLKIYSHGAIAKPSLSRGAK